MATTKASAKESGELSAMLLPELKKVAGQLGIESAATMKKPDLVQAIGDLQASNRDAAKAEREAREPSVMLVAKVEIRTPTTIQIIIPAAIRAILMMAKTKALIRMMHLMQM